MNIAQILKEAVEREASDVILTIGSKPVLKINGGIVYLDRYDVLVPDELDAQLYSIMTEQQRELFSENFELDFSIDLKGYSRFRVNVFISKNGIGGVFRVIKSNPPDFSTLGLPKKILDLARKKNGLLLITGSVGSGKSTTLASILDYISKNMPKHIITVEDPIEYVFSSGKSVVEQREVGTNTKTFDNGLKYALRQASDVIMIGELRDLETFRLALRAAETGNLVLATLHTSGAARTVARIVDMFPGDEKDQIKSQLADSLIGVVWQDLIKTKDGRRRVLASEILVNNTGIANMIRKGLLHQIDGAIETGAGDGMHTMQANLAKLREKGIID